MKKKWMSTRAITEIAILTAIAYVLDALQGGLWRGLFPSGGSIGFAMLPILILSYRRGLLPGLIAGFILSFIQMMGGVYAIADSWYKVLAQIGLDYILAYPCVALAGAFFRTYQKAESQKQKTYFLIYGAVLGGMLKYACHFLAGVFFWPATTYSDIPAIHSLIYNGLYMVPNIIVNTIVLVLISWKVPQVLQAPEDVAVAKENGKPNYLKWLPLVGVGASVFIIALTNFILSFEIYSDEYGTDISFHEDSVVFMVTGIIIMIYAAIACKKRESTKSDFYFTGSILSLMFCCYPLGVFFKALNKALSDPEKTFVFAEHQNYLYVGIIAFFVLIFMLISLWLTKKEKKEEKSEAK